MRQLLDINVTSKENIIRSVYYSNDRVYYIVHYDKHVTCYDDNVATIYRSVVFSFLNKNVLSFSPPKSLTNRVFIEKYPQFNDSTIIVNEYIEGIMVNLFFDIEIWRWDIATRDRIGGKYYVTGPPRKGHSKKKTIYTLFMEACKADIATQELNDLVILSLLPREMSYTFVIRGGGAAPPQLFLVSIHIIYNHKNEVEYVSPTEYETWNIFSNIHGVIMFPKRLNNINTYTELSDLVDNIQNDITATEGQHGYIVLNTRTGDKTKFINRVNEAYKKTKNMEPNLQYQYFCFRRVSKVCGMDNNWISDIPRNRKKFYKINDEFERLIRNVHASYMKKYIYKTDNSMGGCAILDKYLVHIEKIHRTIYLPSLNRETKTVITRDVVRNYFDGMEPRELLYILNADRRRMLWGGI